MLYIFKTWKNRTHIVMLRFLNRCSFCFMKLELSYLVTISWFLNIYSLLFELLKMVGTAGILKIFNNVDNCSKDFLHIVHNEGEKLVDQEYVVIFSEKFSSQRPGKESGISKMKRAKRWVGIISMVFPKKFSFRATRPFWAQNWCALITIDSVWGCYFCFLLLHDEKYEWVGQNYINGFSAKNSSEQEWCVVITLDWV